jgi:hypothetical protein
MGVAKSGSVVAGQFFAAAADATHANLRFPRHSSEHIQRPLLSLDFSAPCLRTGTRQKAFAHAISKSRKKSESESAKSEKRDCLRTGREQAVRNYAVAPKKAKTGEVATA